VRPAAVVPEPEETAPARVRSFSELLLGLDAVATEDWPRATPHLRRALALAEDLADDDQDLLPNLGIAALHIGDDDAAVRFHDRLLARARETGAVVMILYSQTRRAVPMLATGRWTTAGAAAAEALPLAEHAGLPGLGAMPTAVLAVLAARRGEEEVHEHLATVDRIAANHPLGILSAVVPDLVRWARALVADSAPTALHHLEQIAHPMMRRTAAVDRIEGALRAGRRDLAAAWTDELAPFAEATGAAWALAVCEHGRALLAEGAEAEARFERSLALHARSSRTPDEARTQLAYGEFLRRARRRVDARVHLRAALETFEDLGAGAWAERARQELRASGETARRRDASAVGNLTPQELAVAGLVRQGLSNRDVAARLFVSPRTVDFHLRNVFAKLGVTSRTELAASLLFDNLR
jgi:DNA-binding CsgD family transcriptional regulator